MFYRCYYDKIREIVKVMVQKCQFFLSLSQYIISKTIPYNEFLKRIMQGTNIPITTLHQAVSKYTNKNGMIKPDHLMKIL